MTTPMLKEGDVISIGSFKHAVVSSITGLEKNFCEAVYLDNRGKAINEDVRWNGTTSSLFILALVVVTLINLPG
jgi:hypothetical protein